MQSPLEVYELGMAPETFNLIKEALVKEVKADTQTKLNALESRIKELEQQVSVLQQEAAKKTCEDPSSSIRSHSSDSPGIKLVRTLVAKYGSAADNFGDAIVASISAMLNSHGLALKEVDSNELKSTPSAPLRILIMSPDLPGRLEQQRLFIKELLGRVSPAQHTFVLFVVRDESPSKSAYMLDTCCPKSFEDINIAVLQYRSTSTGLNITIDQSTIALFAEVLDQRDQRDQRVT